MGASRPGYLRRFLTLWYLLRWVVAFLAVTLAHALLYYVAPNAEVPFKWITPGGFAATVLMLVSSVGLNLWVGNLGRYDQIYGQVGAIMVLMLWLYVTGLMVLIGAEINAVLARMTEERKDTTIVQPQDLGDQGGTRPNNTVLLPDTSSDYRGVFVSLARLAKLLCQLLWYGFGPLSSRCVLMFEAARILIDTYCN